MVYHDTKPSRRAVPQPSNRIRLAVAGALGSAMALVAAAQAAAAPDKPVPSPRPALKMSPYVSTQSARSARSVGAAGSGQAYQPDAKDAPQVASAKAKIAALYREAERLTQVYDAAEEQASKLTAAVQHSQGQLDQGRQEYAKQQASLGRMAGAEYRGAGLDKRLQLLLSEHPDSFLSSAALADRLNEDQLVKIAAVVESQRALIQLQRTATDQLAALASTRIQAAAARKDVASQLREAQALLNALTASQRRAVAAAELGNDGSRGEQLTIPLSGLSKLPASGRARTAIEAAYADLGKPYVYGAEGPDAFDCSGLIQRIWRQAGVELPRTSSEQAQAGQRVPVDAIQPGDLVIYYAGRNHIGIYVGNGQIIHAPKPGSDVRIAPLNSMPVNMVVRV